MHSLKIIPMATLIAALMLGTHVACADNAERLDALYYKVMGKVDDPNPVKPPANARPESILLYEGLRGMGNRIQLLDQQVTSLTTGLKTQSATLTGKMDTLNSISSRSTADLCKRAPELIEQMIVMGATVRAAAGDYATALKAINPGADDAKARINAATQALNTKLREILSSDQASAMIRDLKPVSGALQAAYGVTRVKGENPVEKLLNEARSAARELRIQAEMLRSAGKERAALLEAYKPAREQAIAEHKALAPLIDRPPQSVVRLSQVRDTLNRGASTPFVPDAGKDSTSEEATKRVAEAETALSRLAELQNAPQQSTTQVCPGQNDDLPQRFEGIRRGLAQEIQASFEKGITLEIAAIEARIEQAERIRKENQEILKDRDARLAKIDKLLADPRYAGKREELLKAKQERKEQAKEAKKRIVDMELALQELRDTKTAFAEQQPAIKQATQPAMSALGVEGQ